jgi:hypothetical protein
MARPNPERSRREEYMALKWTVSHRRRLVLAVAQGEVPAVEMLGFVASIDEHKAQTYRKLFDVSGLTSFFPGDRITALATAIKDRPGPAGPIAVVIADNAQLRSQATIFAGAARPSRLVRVFREQDAAQAWLDEIAPLH